MAASPWTRSPPAHRPGHAAALAGGGDRGHGVRQLLRARLWLQLLGTISFRTPTTPLPMESNPRAAVPAALRPGRHAGGARLPARSRPPASWTWWPARCGAPAAAAWARRTRRMLERLPGERAGDRAARAATPSTANLRRLQLPEAPGATPESFDEHMNLMFDLMALAYQGNLTRIHELHDGGRRSATRPTTSSACRTRSTRSPTMPTIRPKKERLAKHPALPHAGVREIPATRWPHARRRRQHAGPLDSAVRQQHEQQQRCTTNIRCRRRSWAAAAAGSGAASTSHFAERTPLANLLLTMLQPGGRAGGDASATAPARSRRSSPVTLHAGPRCSCCCWPAVAGCRCAPQGRAPLDRGRARSAHGAMRCALLAGHADATGPAAADGTTALHWAVHNGDLRPGGAAAEGGRQRNARNDYGATPMSEAADRRRSAVIRVLLKAGADVESANADGQTALMTGGAHAATWRPRSCCSRRGAKVNAREQWRGQTALMWAAAQASRQWCGC